MLLTIRYYNVTFADRKLAVIVRYTPDGHIEQYTVSAGWYEATNGDRKH
jgi:hypothetical protein